MPIGIDSLLSDHFVKFVGDSVPEGFKKKYYKVGEKEPLYYETGRADIAEFTSVASGGTSGFKNVAVLEPDDDHLYGVVPGVKQGMRFYQKIPTGRDRLGLDEDMDVGFINPENSPWIAPNEVFAFWLVEDMYPAFNAYNDSPVAMTPKIWFRGTRFVIEEVTDPNLIAKLRSGAIQPRNIVLGGVAA